MRKLDHASASKIALGDTERWRNTTPSTNHTSTADLFGLWDEFVAHGTVSPDIAFLRAGAFAYHCSIHSTMHGKVKVRMSSSPSSGTLSTTFTIRVALANAPSGFVEDIQKRKAGQAFAPWKSVTGQTTTFSAPSTGTFEFRARLRRTSDGTATGWSPIPSIKVT